MQQKLTRRIAQFPQASPLHRGAGAPCVSMLRLGLATLLVAGACEHPEQPARKRDLTRAATAPAASEAARAAHDKMSALFKRSADRERDEPPETKSASDKTTKQLAIVDELVDVAPAGPAAACASGVVLISKANEVHLGSLGRSSTSSHPVPTPIVPIDADPKQFVARARGPAIMRNRAYWVVGSRLVRRSLDGGELETLATDARAYTQVVGSGVDDQRLPAAVAYVAVHPRDPHAMIARLWIDGLGTLTLSPEGTTANTVALTSHGSGWLALYLESRTGMSPLHARAINWVNSTAKAGNDFIAWVAGSAQPMTMVRAINAPQVPFAFMPIERDISRFGLARIRVEEKSSQDPEVNWRDYPNGVDPALVATAWVCGKPTVLYSRPSSSTPHAPQELHLAEITQEGLGPSLLIGASRGYSDLSVAALDPAGALVTFVADHRTWARRLRCTR